MTMRFAEADEAERAVLGVTRSATGRSWRHRLDGPGETTALAISQRHAMDQALARIIAGRGIGLDEAAGFLDPTVKALMPDPSTLTDMDAAAARLADAVERGEAVAIFADYDVDGATSAAILARTLGELGLSPVVYVPDRLIEGYGPNPDAITRLAREATLLITLDCGSTSFEALGVARDLGLDTVVVDHHQCDVALPPALAIVNPNRQDDLSGLGHLAACGVTFVVAVALLRELRRRGRFAGKREPDLIGLLDLVALGTVADVVPLVGLNRAFVVKGLLAARSGRNVGLASLAKVARLGGPLSTYHLGFLLGPRINAGGRIGDAALGSRLLATTDPAEAERIAGDLDRLNRERQAIEAIMLDQAVEQVAAKSDPGPVVVTASDRWHPGVVGLIASRLKEQWRRPAFAIAFDRGALGTGSGRSVAGVDLGAAVRAAAASGLLVKGGGHAMAAGLTVAADRLDDFAAHLAERLGAAVAGSLARSDLKLDGLVTASAATAPFVAGIERAGPYGSGHPEPVFALPAHRVAYAEEVGNGHVRATIQAGDGSSLKAIAFRAAREPLGEALLKGRGRPLHIAGALALDHWQGDARVQLRIVDVASPQGHAL